MSPLEAYLIAFIASGSGFLTQTLVSGYWTSAFSDDIFNYSMHLAAFFLSLGVGALLSEKVKKVSRTSLYLLAVLAVFFMGLAIPVVKMAIVKVGERIWFPIFYLMFVGTIVGSIIPLLLRVGKKGKEFSLGKIFFVDYIAALVLSCAFTFYLLVPYGFARTGFIASATGIIVLCVSWILNEKKSKVYVAVSLASIALIFGFVRYSSKLISIRKDKEKNTRVVLSRQSHYQKIVLMEEIPNEPSLQGEKQHVLYLDGFLQFATTDEQTYHACIANVPLMAYFHSGKTPKKVLILGGGDGLAARNVLLVPSVEKVTLVELDPMMIDIAKNHPILRAQNLDALRHPKMEVITTDAFRWVSKTDQKYDLVIIDFPLPKNLTLARLYAAEFYKDVFNIMTEDAVMSIQAGPSFSYEDKEFETLSKVTASILKTLESIGKKAWPYTSVLDNEAFVLGSHAGTFDFEKVATHHQMDVDKGLGRLCAYRSQWKRPHVEVNSLNNLPIASYMLDWLRMGGAFHYRGTNANFLPE